MYAFNNLFVKNKKIDKDKDKKNEHFSYVNTMSPVTLSGEQFVRH